jgi:1,4-dihydroxy-2-naphthoyl-CoA hydrolase
MELDRQAFEAMLQGTFSDVMGITYVEITKEKVVARMPVERRVHQPFGLLHGGASVALAESAASIGATLNVWAQGQVAVGLEINANHLRAKRDGTVTAIATPVHLGRTTHVWTITIEDEAGKPVCVARCTLAIVSRDGAAR